VTDFETLVARREKFAPEVAAARKAEQIRRRARAHRLACIALRKAHPADYQRFMVEAKDLVDARSGPLPGDTS
jgi:hypothetical protein